MEDDIVCYSYVLYKCTALSLGIDQMKKLVKMMKQVKMIKELWSALGYPELGSALDYRESLVSLKLL